MKKAGECESQDSWQKDPKDERNRSNRLFLDGIHLPWPTPRPGIINSSQGTEDQAALEVRRDLFRKAIRALFGPLGDVEQVFVPDRTTKRYAFVRMATASQADLVYEKFKQSSAGVDLSGLSSIPIPTLLFDDIRIARSVLPRNKLSSKKIKKHLANLAEHQRLAQSSNCIIQLHKSHMERLLDFLTNPSSPMSANPIHEFTWKVLGCTSDKAVSFLYCNVHASNGGATRAGADSPVQAFAQWVESIWYVRPILHRIWVFENSIHECTAKEDMKVDQHHSAWMEASNVEGVLTKIMGLLSDEWIDRKSVV